MTEVVDTQAEQDAHLAQARLLTPQNITLDRCRHETVDLTTLWVFREGRQVGVVAHRPDGAWRGQRMYQGMPVEAGAAYPSLLAALEHATR